MRGPVILHCFGACTGRPRKRRNIVAKHCFPKCFLGTQTRKQFLRNQNVSDQIQERFFFPGIKFCFRNKCFLRPKTEKPFLVDNGNVYENVSPKYNLTLSQVFRDYSVLCTLYNTGELRCNSMGTNGFKVKIEI